MHVMNVTNKWQIMRRNYGQEMREVKKPFCVVYAGQNCLSRNILSQQIAARIAKAHSIRIAASIIICILICRPSVSMRKFCNLLF